MNKVAPAPTFVNIITTPQLLNVCIVVIIIIIIIILHVVFALIDIVIMFTHIHICIDGKVRTTI